MSRLVQPSPAPSVDRPKTRSRIAGAGLLGVLLVMSLFAVWTSSATSTAAKQAAAANQLSQDFAAAATAVGAEESLERKYRLEPGTEVQARYDAASAALVAALVDVHRDGDAGDRRLVERLLLEHRKYLAATTSMFAAVDAGDTKLVLQIDGETVDPSFDAISAAVLAGAAEEHQVAVDELSGLLRVESLARWLTPLVFLAGLLVAAVLAVVNWRSRSLLVAERAMAVRDSLHDALTGLPNRTLLADRFEVALESAHRQGTRLGLLVIDLDRFKEINDTLGHRYGDELLIQVGSRLRDALRQVDTVARLGGDEFAILLPDVHDEDEATSVAHKLIQALEDPFRVDGIDLDVEASVGIAVSGERGLDTATLLQRADIAMYVAKTQDLGVFTYDAAVDRHSPARLAVLGGLRRALEKEELVLHYQPKISIGTGDVVGAEALVRWQHPMNGMIPPAEFIPLAEHTGLIRPLTRYVLDRALAQARTWSDAGRPLTVSVNLSARNLLDQHLPDEVAELLAAHGVPAGLLDLEVTESALMTEPGRARQLLDRLAGLGVHISIDDFGAGYTSLGQLWTLPVSELKIDQSFVRSLTQDRSSALIVDSVIDLGHKLGLTIVAEGVEDQRTLAALADIGCDVAQGYHFSRPLPIDAFDRWIADVRPAPAVATTAAAAANANR